MFATALFYNVMNNAPTTQSAAAPQPVTLGVAALLCVFTALITLILVFYGPNVLKRFGVPLPAAGANGKVVSLDFDKVLAAGMKHAMDRAEEGEGVSDVHAQADKFQSNVNSILKSYAAAGYTVINSKAVIERPSDSDITEDVISALGVGK